MLTEISTLRSRLSSLSRGLHPRIPGRLDLDRPLSHKSDIILFDGARRRRKRVVLMTVGCSIATCTMCPFPSESHREVTANNLLRQFDSSLEGECLADYEVLTLFCNGNFFNPREIDPTLRQSIFARARQAGVGYLVVESLPQYLTDSALREARQCLGETRLAVYMGLQSAHDFVRNVCVNTTCGRQAFERACRSLQRQGDLPGVFLLVKPPFLTELESIRDVVQSLAYLSRLEIRHATLCPTRVAPNTVLADLWARGHYQPAWLWSLLEILHAYGEAGATQPMVNTTELKEELNSDSLCFQACQACKTLLVERLEKFLFSRDLNQLRSLNCPCRAVYRRFRRLEQARWQGQTWAQRIQQYLREVGCD
ncbi:hypothetical protein JST97_18760 [bacterium]|nr:hypothetical protein [bacterium]